MLTQRLGIKINGRLVSDIEAYPSALFVAIGRRGPKRLIWRVQHIVAPDGIVIIPVFELKFCQHIQERAQISRQIYVRLINIAGELSGAVLSQGRHHPKQTGTSDDFFFLSDSTQVTYPVTVDFPSWILPFKAGQQFHRDEGFRGPLLENFLPGNHSDGTVAFKHSRKPYLPEKIRIKLGITYRRVLSLEIQFHIKRLNPVSSVHIKEHGRKAFHRPIQFILSTFQIKCRAAQFRFRKSVFDFKNKF